MKPAQSRAARALLDMNQATLAEAASLGLSTVVDFERARRVVSQEAVAAIRAALEAAGVIFVEENGEGPGVRLKKEKSDDDIIANYLPRGPCLIRRASGGGESAGSLAEAFKKAQEFIGSNDGVTTIEVLGQIKIYSPQILRLLLRLR